MDTIVLADMPFFASHGVLPEERARGQRFLLTVEVDLNLRPAGLDDDLAKTVDYSILYQVVKAAFERPTCQLLEAVAERVAAAVLAHDGRVERVRLDVRKPAPPIPNGKLAYASVRIERGRSRSM